MSVFRFKCSQCGREIAHQSICAACFADRTYRLNNNSGYRLIGKWDGDKWTMIAPVRWQSFDGDSASQSYTSEEYARL